MGCGAGKPEESLRRGARRAASSTSMTAPGPPACNPPLVAHLRSTELWSRLRASNFSLPYSPLFLSRLPCQVHTTTPPTQPAYQRAQISCSRLAASTQASNRE